MHVPTFYSDIAAKWGGKREKNAHIIKCSSSRRNAKPDKCSNYRYLPRHIESGKRLLRAEVTLSVKSSWKDVQELTEETLGDTHFLNIPGIHTHPASFACRCAHTHTHRNHTSHLYSPCAAVDRVPLPLSPSLPPPPPPPQCYSACVYLLFSLHNTNNPPGNRNGVCLIIIFI